MRFRNPMDPTGWLKQTVALWQLNLQLLPYYDSKFEQSLCWNEGEGADADGSRIIFSVDGKPFWVPAVSTDALALIAKAGPLVDSAVRVLASAGIATAAHKKRDYPTFLSALIGTADNNMRALHIWESVDSDKREKAELKVIQERADQCRKAAKLKRRVTDAMLEEVKKLVAAGMTATSASERVAEKAAADPERFGTIHGKVPKQAGIYKAFKRGD